MASRASPVISYVPAENHDALKGIANGPAWTVIRERGARSGRSTEATFTVMLPR